MKVILHKLFPYAPYLNEYIGFEDDQREGETNIEAVERLRKDAEQAHRLRYPHLYQKGNEALIESFSVPVPPMNTYVINKEEERINDAIEDCTSKEELKKLQMDSLKYPSTISNYVNKMKTFQ